MNISSSIQSVLLWARRRPILTAVLGLAGIALAVTVYKSSRPAATAYSFFEVRRGDFLVSIVEGGTMQAVSEVTVRSDVDGTARIIFIVPEGSTVKKGDLLVELDSSAAQDAVNQQQINVEKAQFAFVQAEQQLGIQNSVVESEIKAATLKVEFARSDLDKFINAEALQTQRNAQIDITNILETLQIAEERLQWSEKLYTKGFETKGNLDKDRLTVSQARLKLEQSRNSLWVIDTFVNPKTKRSLEAVLQEAQENLDRVKLQGERKMAQFKADAETQGRTFELSQAKLTRDKQQIIAAKIYAPKDGLVVYGGNSDGRRFSNESMIEEGATVRSRQELIKLPDVSRMKLQVKIHESHINQVQLGQAAFIVLDSMPDLRFSGRIMKVAPLPDGSSRFGNPDLKVYATEILVTDELPDVKPGVSARAEIIITNLPQVLTVPIQCVISYKGRQVVYLAGAPQEPVQVNVGQYNTKFIEITSGLKEGDRVLLTPPYDTKEKDLGGAVIADGEKPPPPPQNLPEAPATQPDNLSPRRSSEPRPASDNGNPPVNRKRTGGKPPAAETAE
ncbi:MAG: efflux RND transporter periplasmic adaptor subunit [Acidobacteriia bacterium]|nr:efflux RND transporter periplasmic adaptor subunit [Terriglobia bacterium]